MTFKTDHKYKLTAVSVWFRGRTVQRFVQAPIINGKAVVDCGLIQEMTKEAGATERGQTYTMG